MYIFTLQVIAFMDHFATPTQLASLKVTEPHRQSDKWKSWRAAINSAAIKMESTAMEMSEFHKSRIKESEKVPNVKVRKQQSKKTTVAAVSKRLVNSGFDYRTFYPKKVSSSRSVSNDTLSK